MKIIFTLAFVISIASEAYSQGCVAIRSTGGMTNMTSHPDSTTMGGSWVFTANNRYFKSFRHYKGKEEQKERLIEHTEVINYQYALDMVVTRIINDRWSLMIDVPVLANKRTSLYEHGRTERGATNSFGLGDIRIAAYRWLLNPQKIKKGNVQLGLGVKLPTGDYNYKDFWNNVGPDGERELRTVDQSIQLGDGGTGMTAEINAFFNFSHLFGIYGNFYYLSNPREHNGTRTYREAIAARLANEAIMSVPDQYMARGGFSYNYNALSATLGARIEGIPVYDILGGSGEFRRPGYVWSVEPGISYQWGGAQLFATVPIAFSRNRTQSVTDKEYSAQTNQYTQGDAAFADYSVNFGVSFTLNGASGMNHHEAPAIFNHTTD